MADITLHITLQAALHAYQALWHGQVAAILGRPMENSDVAPLKQEQHRLLCLLAGVEETDSDPAAHFCEAAHWHVDDWLIDEGQAVCGNCAPGSGRLAGGWHDLTGVMVSTPLVREALRRATEGGER